MAPNEISYENTDLKKAEYKAAVVKNVLFTGIPTDIKHKGSKVLHWRITLECTVKEGSTSSTKYISIEYHPGPFTSFPVEVRVDVQKYGHHRNAPAKAQFTLPMRQSTPVTLSDVISLMKSKGRDRFKADPSGNGCLCWAKTILSDMKGQSWFKSGAYETPYAELNAIKKDQLIGGYIVIYGEGVFF